LPPLRVCDGVIACPPGAKIRPRSNAGVCARVPLARTTVFSARMLCTLSRRVLAWIRCPFVHRLPGRYGCEDLVNRALVDGLALTVIDVLYLYDFVDAQFLRQPVAEPM